MDEAHRFWLRDREALLIKLHRVADYFESMGYPDDYIPAQHGRTIREAIKFIEQGEI